MINIAKLKLGVIMKKLRYTLLSFLVFSLLSLLLLSCGGLNVATTSLEVPDFDFSPSSPVAPGSAGIKIALIDPVYSGNFTYSSLSPFKEFRKSMGNDFEEILTARGYILKGPFEAYDLMTYSDKN